MIFSNPTPKRARDVETGGGMRGAFQAFKAFIVAAFSLVCILFAYALCASPAFGGGERYEFYKGTSSSEIALARFPYEKLLLGKVRGESVRYTGDRAEEVIKAFRAKILFTEEAAGVFNYYCYSPVLRNAIEIEGVTVNLHIACNGRETAAGTPVIFGGF